MLRLQGHAVSLGTSRVAIPFAFSGQFGAKRSVSRFFSAYQVARGGQSCAASLVGSNAVSSVSWNHEGKDVVLQTLGTNSGESFDAFVAAMRACARKGRWDSALALLQRRHAICPQPYMHRQLVADRAASNSVLPTWVSDVAGGNDAVFRFVAEATTSVLQAAAPAADVPLVVLMASHVSSVERVRRLQECLSSITDQQGCPKPMAVFVSMSASSEELHRAAQNVLSDFERNVRHDMIIHVSYQRQPMSQFNHLASLLPYLRQVIGSISDSAIGDEQIFNSCWVVFTDDDDIWHPCRILVFRAAIASVMENHIGCSPVAVPVYAMNTTDVSACSHHADVERLMREKTVGIVRYSDQEARERSFLEFWLHAVPARVLMDFVDCTPSATLEHRVCDVRFATFIRDHSGHPTKFYVPPASDLFWM